MAQQAMDFSFWNEKWKQGYYNREKGIRANPLLEYWDKRANNFLLCVKAMTMTLVERCMLCLAIF